MTFQKMTNCKHVLCCPRGYQNQNNNNKTGLQPVSRTLWVLGLQKKKSDSFKNPTGLKTNAAFGPVKPV